MDSVVLRSVCAYVASHILSGRVVVSVVLGYDKVFHFSMFPHGSCGNVSASGNLEKETSRAVPTMEEEPLSFHKPITESLGERVYV